jgi:hypothetical protein
MMQDYAEGAILRSEWQIGTETVRRRVRQLEDELSQSQAAPDISDLTGPR